ncbi:hypothetical protein FQN60_011445, partial [Etheostoma spectabile]
GDSGVFLLFALGRQYRADAAALTVNKKLAGLCQAFKEDLKRT